MNIAPLLTTASQIVPRIPPRIGYAVCDLFGTALGPHIPAYENILANLRIIAPDASEPQRTIMARRVMRGLFKNYFDLFRLPALSTHEFVQTVMAEGLEHIERARTQNRGVLLVAPHCGNYSLIFAQLIPHFDTRVVVPVEQMPDPRVHEIMNRMRQMPGVEIVPLGPQAGRTVLRALKQNQIVMLGGDRGIAENTLLVRFFGQPTPLPSGPATLALRTDAPLLTAFTHRLRDNRSYVRIDPPLVLERSATLQDDVRDVTQKIAYSMQAYIRRDPSQWLVAEQVWPNA